LGPGRIRQVFRGEGSHTNLSTGKPHPVRALAEAVDHIYELQIPDGRGGAVYNIGMIGGGAVVQFTIDDADARTSAQLGFAWAFVLVLGIVLSFRMVGQVRRLWLALGPGLVLVGIGVLLPPLAAMLKLGSMDLGAVAVALALTVAKSNYDFVHLYVCIHTFQLDTGHHLLKRWRKTLDGIDELGSSFGSYIQPANGSRNRSGTRVRRIRVWVWRIGCRWNRRIVVVIDHNDHVTDNEVSVQTDLPGSLAVAVGH